METTHTSHENALLGSARSVKSGVREQPACVYIAGSGRNGSTLLGLHLGRSPEIFFAGELTHIWQRSYLNDELCGCGVPFSRCEFWHEVTATAFGTLTKSDAAHLAELRRRISSFSQIPQLLFTKRITPGARASEYLSAYKNLLDAISSVSASRFVIDSSKYPTDLAALAGAGTIPLWTIHLVRDCNAVVYSWRRKKQRPEIHWKNQLMPRYGVVTTSLAWRLFNSAITGISARTTHPYKLLRYEDLVGHFAETLAELHQWLDTGDSARRDPQDLCNHTVSGNPCRFHFDPAALKLDDEWTRNMSTVDKSIVKLLCGRAQATLGY